MGISIWIIEVYCIIWAQARWKTPTQSMQRRRKTLQRSRLRQRRARPFISSAGSTKPRRLVPARGSAMMGWARLLRRRNCRTIEVERTSGSSCLRWKVRCPNQANRSRRPSIRSSWWSMNYDGLWIVWHDKYWWSSNRAV